MKTLNRPMFKNGGPIKEGIMSGMKEPQAVNTVGNNANIDAMGREKHAFFLPFLGANALRMGAMRMAPRAIQGIKNLFGRNVPQGVGTTNIGGKVVQTAGSGKNIFQPNIAGRIILQDPTVRTAGAIIKGVTSPAVKGPVASAARLVFSPTGVATGLYYANGKFFNKDTNEEVPPPDGEVVLGDRVGTSGAPGGGDPDMYLAPKQSKEELNKITEDRIEANRKKYYKLMGIDKMNKNAAYDSLIDASQIIQEQGGDLKGAIKSGTLQSSIINAISKNLDKSTDLKKQIDAAILKGEITKDIEQSKIPDNIRTARMLGISDAEYKDKILGNDSLKDNLITAYNKQGSFPAGNQLAGFARNNNINIDGVEDSQEVKKWMEANSSNEEGYIQSLVKEGKVPNGTYVINNRIFNVNGQDITSII